MKKYCIYSLLFISSLFIASSSYAFLAEPSIAESTAPAVNGQRIDIMPTHQESIGGIFGQTQSYTVTFRGNGEAVVAMKAIFTNYEEATQSALVYQIPNVRPENIIAYQVIRDKQCVMFEPQAYDPTTQTYKPMTPRCAQYQEPQYDYFYDTNTTYKKAAVTTSGDRLTIKLPQPVKPEKMGAILVYYRTLGYAKKSTLGAYNFHFETLKSEESVDKLTVGITTDSNLYLKDADSQVNYDLKVGAMPTMGIAMSKDSGFSSYRMDDYYREIGYGRIVKTATELQPFDSLTVSGTYAKSRWSLYGGKIALGIIIIICIIVAAIYLIRYVYRKFMQDPQKQEANTHLRLMNILLVAGTGFFTSLLISIMGIISYVFIQYVEKYSYGDGMMIVFILLLLASSTIYPLVLFGPAVMIGLKRGMWWGISTVLVSIVLIILYGIVALIMLYLSTVSGGYYPGSPSYIQKSSVDTLVRE